MSKGFSVIIMLAAVVLIVFVCYRQYARGRDTLVAKTDAVDSARLDLDKAQERRADLIQEVVETVKDSAPQEQTAFGGVAKARSALLASRTRQERIDAGRQLDVSIGHLLLVLYNYPQLKLNQNFPRLLEELAGTENLIAVDRKRYNDALHDYNLCLGKFPNRVFAGWAGFKPDQSYFGPETSQPAATASSSPPPQSSSQPSPAH